MSNIPVFKAEIRDRLGDLIKSCASVAMDSSPALLDWPKAQTPSPYKGESESLEELLLTVGAQVAQKDLYYIESVLVSTGWNKNDDVFLAEELWKARHSPEDKQFNFMHDENDIIGHIVSNYVVDKAGNRIDEDSKVYGEDGKTPVDIDIITESVLYNSWSNPENRDRMAKIIAEIQEGKWFVSMECLFPGFDYAVTDCNSLTKIVARDEQSAFLSKYLRAYGGTGVYQDYKVGRVLRNFAFSGKGLVNKPANPRSVIYPKSVAKIILNDNSFSIGENDMTLETQVADLQKQLADVNASLAVARQESETLKKELAQSKEKDLSEKVQALESDLETKTKSLAEMEDIVKAAQAKVAELQDALNTSTEELASAKKFVDEMKEKKKKEDRSCALKDAGLDETEVSESLASFDNLSDESFESVVALMKKKAKKEEAAATVVPPAESVTLTQASFNGLQTTEPALTVPSADETLTREKTQAALASEIEKLLAK